MGISEKERLRRQLNEKHRMGHSALWLAGVSGLYFVLMSVTGHPLGPMLLSGSICVTAGVQALNKRRKVRAYQQKLNSLDSKEKEGAHALSAGTRGIT
ncbi:ABC transporter ATP-binding protein [Chimaeribacter coloradensis]|uniref:ABC transporter ATP-binding protein n=1 Tax=Chimaeribacter coloradensis TaxID=2060068 RepID=UPI00158802C4|nr:ABC transporter ATP-binding protein [Chimaeribacter coloradensis]